MAPRPPEVGAVSWPAMCFPSMSYPPTVATRGGGRGREPSPARSCRGALPPTKCAQREWPRCTDAKGPSLGPARATRRLGRTRRAALIQRGPEGGVWDSPGRDGSTTRRHRSGRVIDAADGRQPPLVASLLPLTVPATRVKAARPALPMAMRQDDAGPNLGRRVALIEVGVMLRGRGAERRPLGWASHWKVRICGSPGMAGRSACVRSRRRRSRSRRARKSASCCSSAGEPSHPDPVRAHSSLDVAGPRVPAPGRANPWASRSGRTRSGLGEIPRSVVGSQAIEKVGVVGLHHTAEIQH